VTAIAVTSWRLSFRLTKLVDRIDDTERLVLEIDNRGTKAGAVKASQFHDAINAFNLKHETLSVQVLTRLNGIEKMLDEIKQQLNNR
jgi:hypothetical protein